MFRVKITAKVVIKILAEVGTIVLSLSQMQNLKVQSCKLYNSKYMTASTQITNTGIFTFIAVPVFKLLSRKVLFVNKKDNRNIKKVGYFLRK